MLEQSLSFTLSLLIDLINPDLLIPRRDSKVFTSRRETHIGDTILRRRIESNILRDIARGVGLSCRCRRSADRTEERRHSRRGIFFSVLFCFFSLFSLCKCSRTNGKVKSCKKMKAKVHGVSENNKSRNRKESCPARERGRTRLFEKGTRRPQRGAQRGSCVPEAENKHDKQRPDDNKVESRAETWWDNQ